jgi:hypothetical protein
MDNKKLMRILLRDITELQELVAGMKISETYDPFDVELLATRISGVRHMLEVLSAAAASKLQEAEKSGREGIVENPAATVTKTVLSSEPPVSEPAVSMEMPQAGTPVRQTEPVEYASKPAVKAEETVPPQPEPVEYVSKPALKAEETVPPRPEPVEFVSKPVVKEEAPVSIQPEPALSIKSADTVESDGMDNDDMELEEETVTEGPQTLGEKFSHGRSVNDLLLEQGKTDYKFSSMPVASLQAAIGINDRFLFTRELFEGKSDVFAETIRKIDSFKTIHDAAVYLRENFKWKKNETSLKFIDLVKRRFL